MNRSMSRAACIIAPWESLLHEHSSYTDDASPNSKLVPAAQLLTPILTLMQAWVRALPEPLCPLSQSYFGKGQGASRGH